VRYVPAFDGLRGIAVLSVMIFHAGNSVRPLLRGGYIGVDIFFVLSGFLITSILISEFNSTDTLNILRFYAKRARRLMPAFLFMLLLYVIGSLVFLSEKEIKSNLVDVLIAITYTTNWTRALGGYSPSMLGHTWSLAIEEQFYLIWPITLLCILRYKMSRGRTVALILFIAFLFWAIRVVLTVVGATPDRLYNGLDTRGDALMLGSALGASLTSLKTDWQSSRFKYARLGLNAMSAIAIFLLVIVATYADWQKPEMFSIWMLFIEIAAAIIIAHIFIMEKGIIERVLSMSILVWIGSISYGLYLWHYIIYQTMNVMGFPQSYLAIVGIPLSFVAATMSFYCIERKFVARRF